jgi:hypothetical protein
MVWIVDARGAEPLVDEPISAQCRSFVDAEETGDARRALATDDEQQRRPVGERYD